MGKQARPADETGVEQKIAKLSALIERMRELERNNRGVLEESVETRREFDRLMAVLQTSRASLEQTDQP